MMSPRPTLAGRAPAKINLTLHVLGRRTDGYHELASLVAFGSAGDTLTLSPGSTLSLTVVGRRTAEVGPAEQNLVLVAARHLAARVEHLRLGAFRLHKRLPVAAGLGGGSADAAAALRLIARLNRLSADHPALAEAARATGADVPVCLAARARMMHGAGERLGAPLPLPRLYAVLVNPAATLATPTVFAALRGCPGPAAIPHPAIGPGLTAQGLLEVLASCRNDLEAPARALAPVVGEALALLRAVPECRLARMSGSGPTVFGLFTDRRTAAVAAALLRREKPGWWVRPVALR